MTDPGPHGLTRAIWRKSSYSSPTSNDCVEVAINLPAIVAVRDSKNPDGPVLTVTPDGWTSLTARLRATA